MILEANQSEHAKVGMRADGAGLYLRVQESGAKSWIFRFQLRGRRREMGIGMLTPRRAIDRGEDLWHTLNMVQEDLRNGLRARSDCS